MVEPTHPQDPAGAKAADSARAHSDPDRHAPASSGPVGREAEPDGAQAPTETSAQADGTIFAGDEGSRRIQVKQTHSGPPGDHHGASADKRPEDTPSRMAVAAKLIGAGAVGSALGDLITDIRELLGTSAPTASLAPHAAASHTHRNVDIPRLPLPWRVSEEESHWRAPVGVDIPKVLTVRYKGKIISFALLYFSLQGRPVVFDSKFSVALRFIERARRSPEVPPSRGASNNIFFEIGADDIDLLMIATAYKIYPHQNVSGAASIVPRTKLLYNDFVIDMDEQSRFALQLDDTAAAVMLIPTHRFRVNTMVGEWQLDPQVWHCIAANYGFDPAEPVTLIWSR